jgi:hypothetical protein
MARIRKLAPTVLVGLAAGGWLGCPAFHYGNRDIDRTPVTNTGAGASIIYPGQTAPPHPGSHHPREAGYGAPSGGAAYGSPGPGGTYGTAPQGSPQAGAYGAPGHGGEAPTPGSARSSGAPASGGGITMIGGAEQEETGHYQVNESPVYWKYAMLPFAVAAAPFKYAWDGIRGEPEAGPAVPRNDTQPRRPAAPGPPPMDYETAALRDMERELAMREAAAPRAAESRTGTAPGGPAPGRSAPAPPAGGRSIADELAALQRPAEPAPRAAPPSSVTTRGAPAPPRRPARADAPDTPLAAASGRVDRDGDGRTDHWIFRDEGGDMMRESFDDDFDGRPDRTLHYDPWSHAVVRIEEDANQDGNLDTWTTLRDGQVARRRTDANDDGQVDTWSFYREGVITRLERDSNGDGFRDHVAHYRAGRLQREDEDADGDGRPDLVKHYDADEQLVRAEEDADGDGDTDVISHYEGGRLMRRELLDASMLSAGEPRSETN